MPFEKDCNLRMTSKYSQGHRNYCCNIERMSHFVRGLLLQYLQLAPFPRYSDIYSVTACDLEKSFSFDNKV